MSKRFRPTYGRVQNATNLISCGKNTSTIRNIDEEEGELEEKEGTVVSIKQDLINGTGWKVKSENQTYMCSCSASMYELPETKERGGYLYPTETIKVKFQINPILRVNTITEITSLGTESEKIDISKWKHGDEATTIIAKPRSAVSISDGFVTMNYDNNNKVVADDKGVKTEGDNTQINTKETNINSDTIKINGIMLTDLITGESRIVSNEYSSYELDKVDNANISVRRANNITQLDVYGDMIINNNRVIGEIKDQRLFPVQTQSQTLITDGTCVDLVTIDDDGIIYVTPYNTNCEKEVKIASLTQWITPQIESRNYIKVIVKQTCDYCDNGINTKSEFINYCPQCNSFNTLVDTSTSIKCKTCQAEYCQNCGVNIKNSSQKLKFYKDNYISAHGTTCKHCKTSLDVGTNKQYVNYCPECNKWNWLTQATMEQDDNIINILQCDYCNSKFCCTCGIDQEKYGLTLSNSPIQYANYAKALRKLKYIKDGV